jgi:hypothetical protein
MSNIYAFDDGRRQTLNLEEQSSEDMSTNHSNLQLTHSRNKMEHENVEEQENIIENDENYEAKSNRVNKINKADELCYLTSEGPITQGDRLNAIKASRRLNQLGVGTSGSSSNHSPRNNISPIATNIVNFTLGPTGNENQIASSSLSSNTEQHQQQRQSPMTTRRSLLLAAQSAIISANINSLPNNLSKTTQYSNTGQSKSSKLVTQNTLPTGSSSTSSRYNNTNLTSSIYQSPSAPLTGSASLRRSTRSTSNSLTNATGSVLVASNQKRY